MSVDRVPQNRYYNDEERCREAQRKIIKRKGFGKALLKKDLDYFYLINKRGETIMTGTSKQCAEYVHKNSNSMGNICSIQHALTQSSRLKNRHCWGYRLIKAPRKEGKE